MTTCLSTATPAYQKLWFSVSLVFAMALPMLVLYTVSTLGPIITDTLNIPPDRLGLLISGCFGSAAFFSCFSGSWVHRLGSRRSLFVLFTAVTITFTLLALLRDWHGMMAAMIICGIAQALANPVTNLLIAGQVSAKNKAVMVGIKQAGVQFSALIAGLLLPGIAVAIGWRSAIALIIPVALLFLFTTPLITPKHHQPCTLPRYFPNSQLCILMGVQLTTGLCLSAFVTYLPGFAVLQGMSVTCAGTLIALFGIAGMVSRIVLTPIAAKYHDESIVLLTLLILTACAIALLPLCTTQLSWPLWVSVTGTGLCAVGTNAIAMSMLIKDQHFGPLASSSGWVSVAFFSGFAIGPMAFGYVFKHNAQLSWWCLPVVLATGAAMALLLFRTRQQTTLQHTMRR